jgi:hypothetical protein
MPTFDLGANMEFKLKTGETIRGMLLKCDNESMTIWVYDPEGNKENEEKVFKNTEII